VKILYAFQGTGNGHVARARDLVPRISRYAHVDVLVAGTQSDLDLGFKIKYRYHGLTMVYDSKGAVSYWRSLLKNKPIQFVKDVFRLPVKDYDAVFIDFEAVASYACLLRGVPSLQLSHQAAYWSNKTPRPPRRIWHWEWVIAYMSPSKYAVGFHFEPYDSFILPPIIRKDIQELEIEDKGHYTIYLPSYSAEEIVAFTAQFPNHRFELFSRVDKAYTSGNTTIRPVGVEAYLESFRTSTGLICGAGFEAPSEALYCGKKLLISPIKGQYEQAANAVGAERLGVSVFYSLDQEGALVWEQFLKSANAISIKFPDYAEALVQRLVNNVDNGRDYDDISSLQVW
jgi:uncharacterized protein (TIGR00661 family)